MTRRIFIIIGCLVITASLVFLVLLPKYNNFKSLKENIAGTRTELQSKQDYFANLNDISGELEKYQDGLAKIVSALPNDVQLPALFDFFQKTSSKTGLVLKDIRPSAQTSSNIVEGVKANSLTLTLSGDYSSFRNFLEILENSSRLFEIDNISFSAGLAEAASFNLTIKVFSY